MFADLLYANERSNEAAGVHCTDWGCGSLVSGRTCSALGRDRAHRGFDGLPRMTLRDKHVSRRSAKASRT